jgi:hypothetical protein
LTRQPSAHKQIATAILPQKFTQRAAPSADHPIIFQRALPLLHQSTKKTNEVVVARIK